MMRLHLASRDDVSDRSHLTLVVGVPPRARRFVVDVALGSLSMTTPVALDVGAGEQRTRDGARRVSWLAPPTVYLLETRHNAKSAWRDVYAFALHPPMAPGDMVVENAHASSSESDLATRLVCSRSDASRNRVTLRNEVGLAHDEWRRRRMAS